MIRRRFVSWLVAAAAGMGLMVAGCQADSAQPEPGPPVKFDYSTMQVRLPLDEYGMAPEDLDLMSAARLVEYRNCMVAEGVDPAWLDSDEVIADMLAKDVSEFMPDWRFGFWNAEYVAEYGFEGPDGTEEDAEPTAPLSPEHEAALNDPDSAYNLAWEKCADSRYVGMTYVGRGTTSPRWQVFADGFNESYDKANADRRWGEAYREWADCLVSKGYQRSRGGWSVPMPEDATEEMEARLHVDEARCSDEMGTARRMAQLEADYQMEYIAEHEAELAEIQNRVRKTLAEAEQILKDAGFAP